MSTFACPKCGSGTGVVDTRTVGMPNSVGQPYIRRRRKCKKVTCKHRHTTLEFRAFGGKKISKMGDKSQYGEKAMRTFRTMDVLTASVKKELAQRLQALVKQMVIELETGGGKP